MPTIAFHPVSELFPLLPERELAELTADIKTNGLLEPIWTHEQKIVDGRNRWLACNRAKIEPRFREWNREGSLVQFVWSLNGVRRHLEHGQKAAIGFEMLPLLEAEARQRQIKAGSEQGDHGKEGGRGHIKPLTQRIGEGVSGQTKPAEAKKSARHQSESAAEAAKITGTNRQYINDAKKLHAEHPALFEKVKNGTLTIPKAKAEVKREKKAAVVKSIKEEPRVLPKGPFRVIVIDPPWRYGARAEDASHRARNPYPDMDLDEIKRLPVGDLAHKDCILWLWTTNAFMRQAFECLDAWGFENKTILTWVKNRMGLGDWLRGRSEHCLMAVRGKPVVTLTNQTTVLEASLGAHSAKPTEFYSMVDSLCPGNKLEMFSRESREGWLAWGAEAK